MKHLTGEIADGKVVVDARRLSKGTAVTVYVEGELRDLQLDPEMQAELKAAAAAIARAEFVTPEQLDELDAAIAALDRSADNYDELVHETIRSMARAQGGQ